MTSSEDRRPRPTPEDKKKRQTASTASQDSQCVATPKPTRPVFHTPPQSEPANLPTRISSHLSATGSSVPQPHSARKRQNHSQKQNDYEDENDVSRSERIVPTTNRETDDLPSINVFDTTDASSPPGTPCPTCHRGTPCSTSSSRFSSQSPSPTASFDQRGDNSDASLDLSGLSLDDEQTSSVDFKKKNAGPLPRPWIDLKVFQTIRHKALDPKSAKRGDDGYIYILEDKKHPGYVKIGRTRNNPHDRNLQIKRCKTVRPELIEGQSFTTVPCCTRLESIIFADLWIERRCFLCKYCRSRDYPYKSTTHGERFEMSKEDALVRVKLWQGWMRRNPYDAQGVLKPRWQERTRALKNDVSYEEIVKTEHAQGKYWETFMKKF
ncbi:MAG: hypothetical protein Q9202_007505 [Teloschistes flavicans]